MAKCITCGTTLHPERAQKYNYCMARECQEKNAKGLTMVAVGMNKAADELLILDEHTRPGAGAWGHSRCRPAFREVSSPCPAAAIQACPCPGTSPPPVDPAAGKARTHLQRARTPASRYSTQTRRKCLYGDPDHPRRQEPREGLTATDVSAATDGWLLCCKDSGMR